MAPTSKSPFLFHRFSKLEKKTFFGKAFKNPFSGFIFIMQNLFKDQKMGTFIVIYNNINYVYI